MRICRLGYLAHALCFFNIYQGLNTSPAAYILNGDDLEALLSPALSPVDDQDMRSSCTLRLPGLPDGELQNEFYT